MGGVSGQNYCVLAGGPSGLLVKQLGRIPQLVLAYDPQLRYCQPMSIESSNEMEATLSVRRGNIVVTVHGRHAHVFASILRSMS